MNRLSLITALALLALTPSPAPTPQSSPAPVAGFTGTGTLSVQARIQQAPITFDAEVNVMSAKQRFRLDVVHVNVTGGDKSQGAPAMLQLLPHGTITLVYDRATRTTTIWLQERRAYYQSQAKPNVHRTPAPHPTSTPASPLDQFLGYTKSLTEYDTLNSSVSLVGHEQINGRSATLLRFSSQTQKHGDKMQEVHADLALADDLSGLPVRLWMTASGKYDGTLKFDLTSASFQEPSASVFAVPKGYRRVKDLMELFSGAP